MIQFMDEIIFFTVAQGSWAATDFYKVIVPSVILIWFLVFQDSSSSFWNLFFRAGIFLLQAIFSASKKACDAFSDEGELCEEECVEVMMGRLMIFGEVKEKVARWSEEEVLHLFEESEPSVAEIKEAFDVFDENGDGFIDEKEVERILCRMGFSEVSQEDCRKMIMAYDDNKDGKIDFREFLKLMEHSFG
nr:probable calcium-binding protein CML30 [Ipomoea batatas]